MEIKFDGRRYLLPNVRNFQELFAGFANDFNVSLFTDPNTLDSNGNVDPRIETIRYLISSNEGACDVYEEESQINATEFAMNSSCLSTSKDCSPDMLDKFANDLISDESGETSHAEGEASSQTEGSSDYSSGSWEIGESSDSGSVYKSLRALNHSIQPNSKSTQAPVHALSLHHGEVIRHRSLNASNHRAPYQHADERLNKTQPF